MTPSRPLTKRQHEVLRLRATGMPVKQVAAVLGTTERTVKNHTAQAFARIGATCLVEAMNTLGWVRTETHDEYVERVVAFEKEVHRARVAWLRKDALSRFDHDAKDATAESRFLQPINPDPVTRLAKEKVRWR